MINERLFSDFPPFSKEEWKAQIIKDLKGKPYESLVKENVLGSKTEPFYVASPAFDLSDSRRGNKTNNNDWTISQNIVLSENAKADNSEILSLLNKGLTGVILSGNPTTQTLSQIAPEFICTEFSDYSSLNNLTKTILEAFGKGQNTFQIHLNFDPITHSALSGKWSDKKQALKSGIQAVKNLSNYNAIRVFTVKASTYHNCGAGAISEIGLALAQAHEYLVELLESGLSIDDASAQIKVD